MSVKQVIVIRKDLKMRRGKEIAQGSHASMMFMSRWMQVSRLSAGLPPEAWEWLNGSFRKVVVRVNSEDELLDLHAKAGWAGLITGLVKDEGRTEFGGEATYTALAIGPGYDEDVDRITGELELY